MRLKQVSADEAMNARKGHTRETDKGLAIVKAAKAPPSWDATARSARFVMTSEATDRYGDIVRTKGIDTLEFERNPVGLLFHNSRTWPVANWANLEKQTSSRPPRMEGDFCLLPAGGPVPEVDQAAWMIENGGIKACSIGFVPNWAEIEFIMDEEDGSWTGGLVFNTCELVECSICPVPANADALVKSANGDPRLARELLEDVLDNWTRSPEGLLMPRSDFEKAYKVTVEKLAPAAPAKSDAPNPEEPATTRLESIVEMAVERVKDFFKREAPPAPPAPAAPSADEIAEAKALALATVKRLEPAA